ncbi:MAG: YdcF family protein [Sphingomonadales bacterium]|nr:YdcF family protein [Sphingomonadales bacterium]MDE2171047.1 YdcF family protein [Sphingomonadales bacterium]
MAFLATPGHSAPANADRVLMALEQTLFPVVSQIPTLPARNARYEACGAALSCKIDSAVWSEQDIGQLAAKAHNGAAIRRELAGLNGIIHVYGQGQQAEYPQIDGRDPAQAAMTGDTLKAAVEAVDALALEQPSADRGLLLALTLLDSYGRLDAVRFGPLAGMENKPAFDRARKLDWARYRYSAIIVPGIGPEDLNTPLSAGGKVNVHLAAARYHAGLAPFIILSGASVHPRGTRRVEAVEMRKALIERYGVPADALVIDPYARHTTTNMRNASRLLLAMGAPAGKPALVVTHDDQAAYIVDPRFAQRNLTELGYQPVTIMKPSTRNEIPVLPNPQSRTVDPRDPLDP